MYSVERATFWKHYQKKKKKNRIASKSQLEAMPRPLQIIIDS